VVPVAALDQMFAGTYAGSASGFAESFVGGMHVVFLASAGFVLLAIIPSALRGSRTGPDKDVDISPAPLS